MLYSTIFMNCSHLCITGAGSDGDHDAAEALYQQLFALDEATLVTFPRSTHAHVVGGRVHEGSIRR